MSRNKQTVEDYMEGFRHTDRARILACLTDDVEWVIPGMFHVHGREGFNAHIVDEGFIGKPVITVTRLIEEDEVVVAEGTVRTQQANGALVDVVFCDVFDMRDGKIRRLISYLMAPK